MTRLYSLVVHQACAALRAISQALRGQSRRPARVRSRLHLEPLEDRTVPAAFNPTNFADGTTPDTLRGAIISANGNGQDDVITLQAGVYNLSIAGRLENAAAAGDLDVTERGHVVTIQGAGIGETEIDANGLDRVLHVFSRVTLVLRDLTIRGGLATDNGTNTVDARGGGIFNDGGTVTLIGAAVDSNIAQGADGVAGVNGANGGTGKEALGGGIFTTGGILTLKGSKVVHNQAVGGAGGAGAADTNAGANVGTAGNGGTGGNAVGGGIFAEEDGNDSTPDGVQLLVSGLTKSRVDDNLAVGGAGGAGGAGNNGTASGETNNGGSGGNASCGGLRVSGGVTTITSALVRFNDAIAGPGGLGGNAGELGAGGAGGGGGRCFGGGVLLTTDTIGEGSATVTSSTVTLNRAIGGAGGHGGDGASNTSASGGAGGTGRSAAGGAFLTSLLNVSLKKSVISQNLVQGGAGGDGGLGGTSSSSPGAGGSGGAGGEVRGGAVVFGDGTLSLTTTTVNSNRATGGKGGDGGNSGSDGPGGSGGIGAVGGFVQGGAVFVDDGADLSLTRSTISRSSASGGSGGRGGLGLTRANGGDGGAGQGGGLFIEANGQVTVTNSTVSTNTVKGGFGGQNNGAGGVGQGGGIWVDGEVDDTHLDLFNSTVAGNSALDSGGVSNQLGQGGGVFNTDRADDAADNTVTAVSTLFGDNTASEVRDFFGDVSANFSLFESTGKTSINVIPVAGVSADKNVKGKDPMLGALQNNGGPTETHALLSGSPAINKGANPNNLTTDQRGKKPRTFGGKADIGAFEFGAT